MAIEDHPDFEEWVLRLDELTRAKDAYLEAVKLQRSTSQVRDARLRLGAAVANYHRVADEMG